MISVVLGLFTFGLLIWMCLFDVFFVRVFGVFYKVYDDVSSSVFNRIYFTVSSGDVDGSYIYGLKVGRYLIVIIEFVFGYLVVVF